MKRTHGLAWLVAVVGLWLVAPSDARPADADRSARSIVVNGDFEAGAWDRGPARGWTGGGPNASVQEENGNRFLRISLTAQGSSIVEQKHKVDPDWVSLSVSVRIRAKNVRRGGESWMSGMLHYFFNDAKGQHIGGWPKRLVEHDQDWTLMEEEIQVEPGAAELVIQCAALTCSGTFDFDDVSIVPSKAGELPASERLSWGEEPVEALSSRRARICLNGLWRFMPALGPAEKEPVDGDWGYIRVPGSWNGRSNLPGLVSKGRGGAWQGFDGRSLGKAWYERKVKIPADWRSRAILVDLRRVSTDAVVYANGVLCGTVEWPYGEVDITKAVRPGEEATLRILVIATQDKKDVLVAMGVGQNTTTQAELQSRGIIGEVFLTSRPAGPHVSDVFVKTSTRRKELALDVELASVERPGRVELSARVLDSKGREAKRFAASLEAQARAAQTLSAAWTWEDPELWDFLKPNMYTLLLSAKGAGLDDEYAQQFGFREFWIEGRKFYLNGTEFRIRPTSSADEGEWGRNNGVVRTMEAVLDGLAWAGFNCLEMWPWDHGTRGVFHFRELFCEIADRKGFPVIAPALSAGEVIFTWRRPNWTEPGVKEDWERRMAAELRRFRNHPSILFWATTANCFGHGEDQNPRLIGKSLGNELWKAMDKSWHEHHRRGNELCAMIKRHDPTRPVMIHQGGPVSDVYALNNYLCLLPLQDREEWLSEWARSGEMPYMAVEFGTPLHCTMMRGRLGFGDNIHTEPWMTEFCAIYLGAEAYALETPEYREQIRSKFVRDQLYTNWQGNRSLDFAPAFQKLQMLFNTNTFRSWRTMGISGGMVPWSDGHGWEALPGDVQMPYPSPGERGGYFKQMPKSLVHFMRPEGSRLHPSAHAIMANNGPTLAWLAGPREAFTAKDHSFRAGSKVEKQVVLLNDTRAAQDFAFEWKATVAGVELARGAEAGKIETAGTLMFPVRFDLPTAPARPSARGAIRMNASIGGRKHEDSFEFRVFPPEPRAKGALAIFDPEGRTTRLLTRLGYSARPWRGSGRAELLVIGREALSKGHSLPGDLEAFVRGGARAIIFAQDPAWLEGFVGFRVAAHISRRVFPVSARHPVVAGLDAEDLRDWVGESTLVEPYPDYLFRDDVKKVNGGPWWGWRWGSRGGVSSAAIEKPHLSGWRPILECEFDLAYSPLMELDYGSGRLVLCTLDLEDHAEHDPAAERLAHQVVEYARTSPLAPRAARVSYLGDAKGEALLDLLGLVYSRGERPSGAGLLVVGQGADMGAVEAHVRSGGKALVLARRGEAVFGARVVETAGFHGSLDCPDWPEAAGLSPSDLRWRTDTTAWLLEGSPGVEVGANGLLGRARLGAGVAIVCQLDPDALGADQKTYFRFTRWRQTRAIAQILANLGASFRADSRIFHPENPGTSRLSLSGMWKTKMTKAFPAGDRPGAVADRGISEEAKAAVAAEFDDSGWKESKMPGMWEEFSAADGEAVFRKAIEVPAQMAGKPCVLSLGAIDDFDDTYVNGVLVGRTDIRTKDFWRTPRLYKVPVGLLKAGRNVVAVRVFDHFGGGGFGGQPHEMVLRPEVEEKKDQLYHPDYREDFERGDDPYRYFRW